MPVWSSSYWVLERWRATQSQWSAAQTAARIGISRQAWDQWEETGRVPHERVEDLDRAFGAEGALADLLWACSTPEAFSARTSWAHNVIHRGAVWVWVRGASGEPVVARLRWGPVEVMFSDQGRAGIALTSPVAIPNPPIELELRYPGWADWGRGHLPGNLGIPVISGVPHMRLRRTHATDPSVWTVTSRLQRLLSRTSAPDAVLNRVVGDGEFVRGAFAQSRPPPPACLDLSTADRFDDRPEPVAGPDCRRVRVARGLSQDEVVHQVNKLDPGVRLTKATLQRFENGSEPRLAHLRSRLDTVYGAGGHLCCEKLKDAVHLYSDAVRFCFPGWWVGPVWVLVLESGSTAPGMVSLSWGPWAIKVKVRPGQVFTFRKAPSSGSDLFVRGPVGWAFEVGVGVWPGAHDANHDWTPTDDTAERRLWKSMKGVYVDALNGSRSAAALAVLRARRSD